VALAAGSASAGDVLVLIHGFPLHAAMWQPQLDSPPAGWRVFAPDLRGFGSDANAAGVDRLTMDLLADDVAVQLQAAGIDRAVICGLSMGGYVAFALLRRAPGLVRALVLADTRAGADSDEARSTRLDNARRVRDEGTGFLVDDMLPKLLTDTTRRDRPEVEAEVRQILQAAPADSVAAALLGMAEREDSTGMLPSIDMPTLVVVGAEDVVTPPAAAREMADAIPGARLEVIDGAAHLSNLERPDEFNRILSAFLARLPG
jgi:3-oxoadipate enol-lactonase